MPLQNVIIDACGLFGHPEYIIYVSERLEICIHHVEENTLETDNRFVSANAKFSKLIKIFPSLVKPEIYCVVDTGSIVTLRWADTASSFSSEISTNPPPDWTFSKHSKSLLAGFFQHEISEDEISEDKDLPDIRKRRSDAMKVTKPEKKVRTESDVIAPNYDTDSDYVNLLGSHDEESVEELPHPTPSSSISSSIPTCSEKSQLIVSHLKLDNKIIITVGNIETGRDLVRQFKQKLPCTVFSLCNLAKTPQKTNTFKLFLQEKSKALLVAATQVTFNMICNNPDCSIGNNLMCIVYDIPSDMLLLRTLHEKVYKLKILLAHDDDLFSFKNLSKKFIEYFRDDIYVPDEIRTFVD
ncbi:hypothetical protein GEMRC1_006139 [Eukaryota sp. GEM-RC1]